MRTAHTTSGQDTWGYLAPPPRPDVTPRFRPSFSVVVAAYQAAGTLGEAIESALQQTSPAVEVVVCDDGSTDGTAEVLDRFGDRVVTVRQANQGEAAAKNAAVRAARGDYVAVLDADDVFFPRRLEALGWLASLRPDLDVITTNAVVEAGGRVVRHAYHPGWRFEVEDQRGAILRRNFVLGLAAVRRDSWLAVGGFDEQLAHTADWDFWQRLILSGSRVGLLEEPLARYRLSVGTLSSDRVRLVRARLTVLRRALVREDLTPDERDLVRSTIRQQEDELRARLAAAALEQGGWEARRRSAALLLGRRVPLRTRLGAALAVANPRLAACRRRRHNGDATEIGSGVMVPAARSAAPTAHGR
jgi:hypothetical protein